VTLHGFGQGASLCSQDLAAGFKAKARLLSCCCHFQRASMVRVLVHGEHNLDALEEKMTRRLKHVSPRAMAPAIALALLAVLGSGCGSSSAGRSSSTGRPIAIGLQPGAGSR
jgi:hypothetical protein